MEQNKIISKMIISVIIFIACVLFLLPVNSPAQTVVVGEGITFTPADARPGQTVFADIRFRVESSSTEPIPINFSIVDVTATPNSDRPSLSGHSYAPGRSFTIRAAHLIPNPAPARKCFNVYAHFPGTGLSSAQLINNACLNTRLRLANRGTGHRITEAYRSSDAPGAPTVVEPAIVGLNSSFAPMNLEPTTDSPRSNMIDLILSIDYMGTTQGRGSFYLLKEGREIMQINSVLNPGRNLVHTNEQLGSPHTTVRVPAQMNYNLEIGFPNIPGTDHPRTPRQLLIGGIQLETIIFSLSGGTGQRITLPTALKSIPRTGVHPARPNLP
jgi:hypothetical protein